MSKQVTCTLCGRPVDDADCVEMPNGLVCQNPCYTWLETMMEQVDDDEIEIVFEPWEDDDDTG